MGQYQVTYKLVNTIFELEKKVDLGEMTCVVHSLVLITFHFYFKEMDETIRYKYDGCHAALQCGNLEYLGMMMLSGLIYELLANIPLNQVLSEEVRDWIKQFGKNNIVFSSLGAYLASWGDSMMDVPAEKAA